MLATMRKTKFIKAKLTLKKKQIAIVLKPIKTYRREHIDGEENIAQLVPLKLMRSHSVLSLMMLPNGLHSSISNYFRMMKLQKCW